MKTDLPTKPGPYYWRESDGDELRWADVFGCSANYFASIGLRTRRTQDLGGQWLRIPDAAELVELQRKAEAYDEGKEAWAVYKEGNRVSEIKGTKEAALKYWLNIFDSYSYYKDSWGTAKQQGYTCRKVRIVEEIEKGRG